MSRIDAIGKPAGLPALANIFSVGLPEIEDAYTAVDLRKRETSAQRDVGKHEPR